MNTVEYYARKLMEDHNGNVYFNDLIKKWVYKENGEVYAEEDSKELDKALNNIKHDDELGAVLAVSTLWIMEDLEDIDEDSPFWALVCFLVEDQGNDFEEVIDAIYETSYSFNYGREEYLVLTDDEADQKANSYGQDLADDMLHGIPETIKYYFDEERFLEDTRSDNRSALASYDGYEHESGDYYIFRIS